MNKTLATLTFSGLLGLSVDGQNLVLNGGFESPLEPANTINSAVIPDSWAGGGIIVSNYILNGNGPSGNSVYPFPHSGQQYVGLGWLSALSQSFTVANNNSGQYTVAWFDSSPFVGPIGTSPYTVTLFDTSSNIVFTKSLDAAASAFGLWTQHSIEVSLQAGTYTLSFLQSVIVTQTGFIAQTALIDDVSIQPVPVGQACPCAGPVTGGAWKNHGQYVACVAHAAENALSSGSISEDQRDALVEAAAQSTCGQN